jgi:hypothetical protein
MGAYKASTLLDFEHGLPLELESLFFEPLRWAQKAGVPTPRLAALCAVLHQLSRSQEIAQREMGEPPGLGAGPANGGMLPAGFLDLAKWPPANKS